MNILFVLNFLLVSSTLFAAAGLGLTIKKFVPIVRFKPGVQFDDSALGRGLSEPLKDIKPNASGMAKPESQPELGRDSADSLGFGDDRLLDDSDGRLRALAPFMAAAAIVGVVGGLVFAESITSQDQLTPSLPRNTVCQTLHPAILFIKPQGPSPATAKVVAACDFNNARIYLIIEKVINVSSNTNPHPVYFIKATLPHLQTGRAHTSRFVLKEPVGTEADFYVISVNHAGLLAMGQNQVVDHGILQLPAETRQESDIEVHIRT
jgi:hypothetical protein